MGAIRILAILPSSIAHLSRHKVTFSSTCVLKKKTVDSSHVICLELVEPVTVLLATLAIARSGQSLGPEQPPLTSRLDPGRQPIDFTTTTTLKRG